MRKVELGDVALVLVGGGMPCVLFHGDIVMIIRLGHLIAEVLSTRVSDTVLIDARKLQPL